MTAPKARLDSRLRGNDGDIHPRLIRGGFAAATFAALQRVDSCLRGNDEEVVDSRRNPALA